MLSVRWERRIRALASRRARPAASPLMRRARRHGEDRGIAICQPMAVEPGFGSLRRVATPDPFRQRQTAGIFHSKIQKGLQPALMLFGEVQIGETLELFLGFRQGTPATPMQDIKRRRETGTILAAGAFDQE